MGNEWVALISILLILISITFFYLYRYSIFNSKKFLEVEAKVHEFFRDLEKLQEDYIPHSIEIKLINDYLKVRKILANKPIYLKSNNIEFPKFIEIFDKVDLNIIKWNKEFIEKELKNRILYFDDIDGK